jgi:ABC-type transport system involved in multi-copper enzyme maturation permease subunit
VIALLRADWLRLRKRKALVLSGLIALAVIVVLAVLLPLAIVAVVGQLPQPPPVDAAAVAVLVGGLFISGVMLIGFGAAVTLVIRSGGFTLVVAFVYVLAESAVVGLVARLEPFRPANSFGAGNPAGPLAWVLDLFPVHAVQDFIGTATQATGGVVDYGGQVATAPLANAYVPLAFVAGWAALFIGIAVRRFDRMDIAE